MPRKLTVTRVAALRSREITENGWRAFHRAATADGADRSGLTALTYATMMTYAVDAAVAVALANTLFFAAATAESKTNVALYLAITVAPFALVAPVIGPLLDRLQRGRRTALAVSFGGRAVLAVVMAFGYDSWVLYPAALGAMVLSKSFVVLKAAVTPRVLPETITLVTTNSRLTTFGLASGALFGARRGRVRGGVGLAGGAVLHRGARRGRRAPVPADPGVGGGHRGRGAGDAARGGRGRADIPHPPRGRTPMGRTVLVALWGNAAARVLTGFLTLFVAFVVKAQTETETEPTRQLLLIGVVGAAAGLGSFLGNAIGARQRFDHSDALVLAVVGIAATAAAFAAFLPGHRHGRDHRAGGRDVQRAGQGRAGRGGAARTARTLARVGVRPLGDGAAARLGVRRRARRAAPPRHLPPGLRRRRRRDGTGRDAGGARQPRPDAAPVLGPRPVPTHR